MAKTYSQFYFTKPDPDYSIKGSRDPLGLQVIWQQQGRKLIPYLSSVSNSLQDFQILCLGYHFYGKEPDNAFVRFFLRFEQLMGYVRNDVDGAGFNGVDRIRKKLAENPRKISISNTSEDEIMSDQRSYGIWGKYNRPFRDLQLTSKAAFSEVFDEKINSLSGADSIKKNISKIIAGNQAKFDVKELDCMRPLLKYTKKERGFYRDAILHIEAANPYQNQLFEFISNTALPDSLDLYPFLKSFSNSLGNGDGILKGILTETAFTEKLLCPLNRIFRYIQTKPIWEKNEIISDNYISKCKKPLGYIFAGGSEACSVKNHLNQSMVRDNWSLVKDLAIRNKEVTEWRGGAPWITINNNIVEVFHADGGHYDPNFNPNKDFDNFYFLLTYLKLYSQSYNR